MEIVTINNTHILIKENGTEVNINDGDIIQYTGIYYKKINDIVRTVQIETTFVGVIETSRYRYDTGVTGIYIKPIYIWDIINNEWLKIVNLNPPTTKYFLYPHLLMLPQYIYGHGYPLNFLQTCENKSLDEFINIKKEFNLDQEL
jgi:hypothetical protein